VDEDWGRIECICEHKEKSYFRIPEVREGRPWAEARATV
jgi:hypothetical protein